MALPKTFFNDDAYFRAVVDFLHTYSWVYSEANTSCIKALDSMPLQFKDYFLGLSNDNLNLFPFVQEPLEGCPDAVQYFRQQIAKMTPQQSEESVSICPPQTSKKCSNQNRKIGLKKSHEIEQLADKIHIHCEETQTQLIIDLGSGLGYLSEALFKLKNNYLILGLEADEKRVKSAKQRFQKFLPQEALKTISYKNEFIKSDNDSRTRIQQYASDLAQSHGLPPVLNTAIIGLHACADLSISAMILFLTMPQVRSLHIMPCCYHKLALREDNNGSTTSPFVNFPLSNGLRKAMTSSGAVGCFQRPFMRLACQETNSRWRIDSSAHTEHGRQMYMRAMATSLCDVDELVKVRVKSASRDQLDDGDTFNNLQYRYQLYSQQTGKPLPWRHVHEARFNQVSESYSDGRGCRLAEALCCLQTSIQKLSENLVLYDRLCYLKDTAARQQLQLEVRYERLFDEQISPRCHCLIAKKL